MSIASPPLVLPRSPANLARDYAELTKLRVTSLVVMTAWCGYYFGAARSGISSLSWGLVQALVGVALVAGGAAALNEVMEFDIDGRMRRTAGRPLPTGRMSRPHATIDGMKSAIPRGSRPSYAIDEPSSTTSPECLPLGLDTNVSPVTESRSLPPAPSTTSSCCRPCPARAFRACCSSR